MKYKYKVMKSKNPPNADDLNWQADEGWELIHILHDTSAMFGGGFVYSYFRKEQDK